MEHEATSQTRLVGKSKAAGQEHLCQIAQIELVTQPPHDDQKHDVRGILNGVKGRTGSFIEKSLADLTMKFSIP